MIKNTDKRVDKIVKCVIVCQQKVFELDGVLSLCLKITNWCNLNCAHCCENSGSKEPLNFMPLEKFEHYIYEFKKLPFKKSDYVVIGGGEGMAPYLFHKNYYIPAALSYINGAGYIPTIKTNGLWGAQDDVCMDALRNLALVAELSGVLSSLDISIDEFHNNINEVANIFSKALSNEHIMSGVRISLVGFNTVKSMEALYNLKNKLISRNLCVEGLPEGDWGVYNERGMGFRVLLDYHNAIFDWGRAKQNKVYTVTGKCDFPDEICLTIDNKNNATMNCLYTEPIGSRKLSDVITSLYQKTL